MNADVASNPDGPEEDDLLALPIIGYGPAERVARSSDLLLDLAGNHDIDLVTDELWMDVIAEEKFNRRIPRSAHGTRGGARLCRCFLCMEWKAEEKRRTVFEDQVVLPLEHPDHPMHHKDSDLG